MEAEVLQPFLSALVIQHSKDCPALQCSGLRDLEMIPSGYVMEGVNL